MPTLYYYAGEDLEDLKRQSETGKWKKRNFIKENIKNAGKKGKPKIMWEKPNEKPEQKIPIGFGLHRPKKYMMKRETVKSLMEN
jgi:hypothetical protein